jgi:hypothetical protein
MNLDVIADFDAPTIVAGDFNNAPDTPTRQILVEGGRGGPGGGGARRPPPPRAAGGGGGSPPAPRSRRGCPPRCRSGSPSPPGRSRSRVEAARSSRTPALSRNGVEITGYPAIGHSPECQPAEAREDQDDLRAVPIPAGCRETIVV